MCVCVCVCVCIYIRWSNERIKSKYFKINRNIREFAFKLFILLHHVFLTFQVVFRK